MYHMMRIDKSRTHMYQLWKDSEPVGPECGSCDEVYLRLDSEITPDVPSRNNIRITFTHIPDNATEILCRLQWLAEEHLKIGGEFEIVGNTTHSMTARKISNMLVAVLQGNQTTPIYSR